MIKTALIGDNDAYKFVENLNSFIADKKVVDIKYISFTVNTKFNLNCGTPLNTDIFDRALVIYEEE